MNTELLIAQGNELRAQHRPLEALKCYAQAFVEDPDSPSAWNNYGNALKSNIKNIAKFSSRVSKNADKSTKRKKNAKTRPSGFEKPTPISDELAVFFGKELGSLMARTEVSKQIHEYVMSQKLQNEKNRRIIHPDPKLKQLLNVNNDELTYFNLQKYLKFHFKKDVAPVTKA